MSDDERNIRLLLAALFMAARLIRLPEYRGTFTNAELVERAVSDADELLRQVPLT